MHCTGRHLFPFAILLSVAALFGWLVFTKVFVSYAHFMTPGPPAERFERGWPMVFIDTFEHPASGNTPPQSGPLSFSVWALAADLSLAFAVLAIVAVWLKRRLRRPRPWQLSLKGLLIVVAIAACVIGWLAREFHVWQRERKALESLPNWSMREEYCGPQWLLRFRWRDKLVMFHHVASATTPVLRRTGNQLTSLGVDDLQSFTTTLPSLPWLREVEVVDTLPAGFDEFDRWASIERLILPGIFATDDVLRRISRMPRLKSLNLYMGEEFTDEGVASLARIESLQELKLDSTTVTDRGIAALARLPRLRVLSMTQTAITDASIASLCQMRSLEKLEIYATQISDQGARRLVDLPRLKELWLPFNNVSEETADFLRTKIAWVQRY